MIPGIRVHQVSQEQQTTLVSHSHRLRHHTAIPGAQDRHTRIASDTDHMQFSLKPQATYQITTAYTAYTITTYYFLLDLVGEPRGT